MKKKQIEGKEMNNKFDYINLMDISKMNLNKCIDEAIEMYKKEKSEENKLKLIKLIEDRKKIFLFDKETIKKYV